MNRGRRRRSRSGGWSRTTLVALLALALVGALAYGVAGSGAYTTGALDRGSSVPVASDANGLLALDVADAVTANETSRLVTATNHLGQSVTVTVALRPAAADDADLVVDGATVGDSASVTLAAGANQTVDVAVEGTASDGSSLAFDVDADGTGVTVSAPNRSTTVTT
ncbi:hypothetical protein EFA46_011255 (plasmid) [Halarchaeum sp. CBA1220]|uniref:hypothetical protein n=1 Tax=Halarchaeum sp. CBA1220 TaxID=1853682 RepID=UPI000F3A8B37|nr:hypothetical protein [Halarchaeum sp. CBA1220]QLC34833.1 hypothetical protein EFA46_011255 [Halarchaeum sp. CBA1220]